MVILGQTFFSQSKTAGELLGRTWSSLIKSLSFEEILATFVGVGTPQNLHFKLLKSLPIQLYQSNSNVSETVKDTVLCFGSVVVFPPATKRSTLRYTAFARVFNMAAGSRRGVAT